MPNKGMALSFFVTAGTFVVLTINPYASLVPAVWFLGMTYAYFRLYPDSARDWLMGSGVGFALSVPMLLLSRMWFETLVY